MARRMTRRYRRNPKGTLLVNKGRKGKSRRYRRHRRNPLALGSLLSSVYRANPRRRSGRSKRRIRVKSYYRRRNPLLRNPIQINRRNPNGLHRMAKGVQSTVAKTFKKVPVVGGVLAGAVGTVGSVIGGAAGVFPLIYGMRYLDRYMDIPNVIKPVGYSLAGMLLSAIVRAIPTKIPYKGQLATGLAFAGGAVDAYRFAHDQSDELGDEYGDSEYGDSEYGDSEYGDSELGDGEYGDIGTGEPHGAIEFADADLGDAEYCGADFSAVEIEALGWGQGPFWKKFHPKGPPAQPPKPGVSHHAGVHGRRWGWMIYWIGFDNARKVAGLPEGERRKAIEAMRAHAKAAAHRLLERGEDTSMQGAEMAGLLVTAA